ncbi:MAG: hypothetical protein JNK23_07620 [Opitutaceae bacterium]|nr:hypothetical protein [Opitutaceae bacterium]
MDYPLIGTKTKAENAEAKKDLREMAIVIPCFLVLCGAILLVILLLPESETQQRSKAERAFAEQMMRDDSRVKSLSGWIYWVEIKKVRDHAFFFGRGRTKLMHERTESNERIDGSVWFKVEAEQGSGWVIVDYWCDYKTGERGLTKIDLSAFSSPKRFETSDKHP